MIISPSRRFAFVHIHKTAGESVSTALASVLAKNDLLMDGGPRNALRRRILPHYRAASELDKHSPARSMRDHVGAAEWSSLYSFAVVRDPMKRAISLYRYLHTVLEQARSSRARELWYRTPLGRPSNPEAWLAVRAIKETRNFGEFIRHPYALADPGFQSQTSMVDDTNGTRLVTRIIHLENLVDEFADVQDAIGIHPHIQLPHENPSKTSPSYSMYEITEDDRAFIAEHFAADYRAFGYATP